MFNTKHKCASRDCNNIINQEEKWCESCLDELGKLIEKYPLGFVPSRFGSSK